MTHEFFTMLSRHRAFRSIEVQDGYPVTALSHSPSGDRFIVGTGSSQPKVYDREGVELMKFVKGDMYLRDLANTKVIQMNIPFLFSLYCISLLIKKLYVDTA